MRPCAVEDCERSARSKGYCSMHYKRLWKTGDPLGLKPKHPPWPERFQVMTERVGDCLEWTGARTQAGYGKASVAGVRWIPAHRAAWELANGPIPDGTYVLHRCDNPPCVAVNHLFLGTHSDNMRDMLSKNRGRWTSREWDESQTVRDGLGKFVSVES